MDIHILTILFSVILFAVMVTMAGLLYWLWQHRVFQMLLYSLFAPSLIFSILLVPSFRQEWSVFLAYVFMTFLHGGLLHLYKPKLRKPFLIYLFSFVAILLCLVIEIWYPVGIIASAGLLLGFIGFVCWYSWPLMGRTLLYLLSLAFWFFAIVTFLGSYVFSYSFAVSLCFIAMSVWFLFMVMFRRFAEMMLYMSRSSFTDPLTGLYNRRYFTRQAEKAVADGVYVSAIFCDLDNFKRLNDTQGHDVGDEQLIQVARILSECCEDVGIVGRYGGEEMVVLVTKESQDPVELAERIRERVENESLVTVSVGVCRYVSGMAAAQLLKCADEAMYEAKTSGKNRVVLYSS